MMRKVLSISLLFVGAGLIWYLFLKPSDYTVRFKANAFPGTINQSLKLWDIVLDTVRGIRQEGDLKHLSQQLRFNDSTHTYNWTIKPLTDSTSQVAVHIGDDSFLNSLKNKIQVPFVETDFTQRCKKTVMAFMEELDEHTQKIRVEVVGEAETPATYVAYIPLRTAQMQKAGGMMKNYSYLTGELLDNQVKFNGLPMVVVNAWDRENDSVSYDFAQPIVRSEKLPIGTEIKYRRLFKKKALKAIYHGNYITSDRAWYALLDYAEKNGIAVEPTPIEVFHNNPKFDGDEEEWKAEIYMPIKESDE